MADETTEPISVDDDLPFGEPVTEVVHEIVLIPVGAAIEVTSEDEALAAKESDPPPKPLVAVATKRAEPHHVSYDWNRPSSHGPTRTISDENCLWGCFIIGFGIFALMLLMCAGAFGGKH